MQRAPTLPPPHAGLFGQMPSYQMLDIQYFLEQLSAAKWGILRICLLSVLLAAIYAVRPKPYEVSATIRIDPRDMRDLFSGVRNVDSEVDSIYAWTSVERVLDKLPYYGRIQPTGALSYITPFHNGIQSASQLPVEVSQLEFPDALSGKSLTMRVIDARHYTVETTGGTLIFNGTTGESASGTMTVLDGKGDAVTGHYRFRVDSIRLPPESRIAIIPAKREAFIQQTLRQLKVTKRTSNPGSSLIDIQFFNPEPNFSLLFTQALMNDYIEQSYERIAVSKKRALSQLEADLGTLGVKMTQSEQALADYMREADVVDVEAETANLLDMQKSISQSLRELSVQKAELGQIYTSRHPAMNAALEEEAILLEKFDDITRRLATLPQIKSRLVMLNREATQNSTLYQSVIEQYTQLKVDIGAVVNTASVVNNPRIIPGNPVKALVQLVVLGGMMGMIVSVGSILIRSAIRRGVLESARQLQSHIDLPVLDVSYPMDSRNPKAIAGLRESLKLVASQFRFMAYGAHNNIVVITSDRPAKNKSQLSYRLAKQFAETQRTLLIDAHVMRSRLQKRVGIDTKTGLTNAMIGDSSADSLVQRIGESDLYYMPPGERVITYQILHDHTKMKELLKGLSGLFDRIVIDLPSLEELRHWQETVALCGSAIHVVNKGRMIDNLLAYFNLPFLADESQTVHMVFMLESERVRRRPLLSRLYTRSTPDASTPASSAYRQFY